MIRIKLPAIALIITAAVILCGIGVIRDTIVSRYDLPEPMNVQLHMVRYDLPDPMTSIIRMARYDLPEPMGVARFS